MEEKLRRGDYCTIWFAEDWNPRCYASCEYKGRRNGKHVFKSLTYGWNFIVDTTNGTVVNDYSPNKIMKVNNETGWMKYLP